MHSKRVVRNILFKKLVFGILIILIAGLIGIEPIEAANNSQNDTLGSMTLGIDGPPSVAPGETFQASVVARDITGEGLYGVQLEINYDPSLISASNLQVNPNLTFLVLNSADNTSGKIRLVASQQGNVPGLTGEVTLLTFDATAAQNPGPVTFTFENEKFSDPQAQGLESFAESYTVSIDEVPTPEPTDEPTSEPTDEPTTEPTDEPTPESTDEPTPDPTDEPTSEPTDEPTPEPTDEPTTEPTPEPTDEPTPEPTDEPTPEPTDEPTPEPTDEPTPEPTDEPTPESTEEPTPDPTDEPTIAIVFGQVILAGRDGNDWSDANVTIDDSGQTGTTDPNGEFSILDVTAGVLDSITVDASGYLPAICTQPTIVAPETSLATIALLSGDINDDSLVDITDATMVGAGFGQTGPDMLADINRDEILDIFDIVLVSINYGAEGSQTWNCMASDGPVPPIPPTPVASLPLCDEHDPLQWHGLISADGTCHYNHEHKHNPHELDDIFGPPGAWWNDGVQQELNYPWQTFEGANSTYAQWDGDPATLENSQKHQGYGWIVRKDIPQDVPSGNRDFWIKNFRLQFHGITAPPGTLAHFHSFGIEAQICSSNGDCGIVRKGGWIDYGNLEVSGHGIIHLPDEDNPTPGDDQRRRLHFFYQDPEFMQRPTQNTQMFWYGRNAPRDPAFLPLATRLALGSGDVWSNVDPDNPTAFNFFCPDFHCEKNGSTIQMHVLELTIDKRYDKDKDGFADFQGFVDRYGLEVPECSPIGVDCIPVIIDHVPINLDKLGPTAVQFRDDADLQLGTRGLQDFDLSPAALGTGDEWWIEYPN